MHTTPTPGDVTVALPADLLAAIASAAFAQCLVTAEAEALNGSTTSRQDFAQQSMCIAAALALQMHTDPGKQAIHHLLQRIQRNPHLAYYFDPATRSFDELTQAHAEHFNLPVERFRKDYAASLTYQALA